MTCDGRSDELAAELEIPVRRGEAGNLPLMSPPGGALHETRDRYSGGPYGLESTPSIDTGSTRLVAVTGNESLCGTGASPVTIGQRPGLERLRIPRGPPGSAANPVCSARVGGSHTRRVAASGASHSGLRADRIRGSRL